MKEKTVPVKLFLLLWIVPVSMTALVSCSSSPRIALDPESRDFFDTARLIMSKEEQDIFLHLPDKETREEFIREFWHKRDPDPSTDENRFKEEFFRRIEHANSRFREGIPGWKTDRGRIYTYLGPPDKTEEYLFHQEPDIRGPILVWVYYDHELAIRFVDATGMGHFRFDPFSDVYGNLLIAIDQAKFGAVSGESGGKRQFIDFSLQFDRKTKEIIISIPVKALTFKEDDGVLKADFEFDFYLYRKEGAKIGKTTETKSFEGSEKEILELEDIVFTFPFKKLEPGDYYFDVVLTGKDIGKARKIIEIRV